MPTPRATVTIANYNGAEFLERTVRSVLAQSMADFELVVVDNRSTDRSREIVQAIDDPRLRLEACDEHVPVTANWNRCLDLANAPFFALLHSDDTWEPEFLERVLTALEATPTATAAVGNARVIDAEDVQLDRRTFSRKVRTRAGTMEDVDRERLLCEMTVFPCSWACRRELVDELRFDERYTRAPDWDFWLRVFDDPRRVVSVPDAWSGYRLHGSNDTFSPATLRGMWDDEARIVAAAIARRAPRGRIARRARRMVDVRSATRCAQVLVRGDRRTARALVADMRRRRGIVGVARGFLGVLTLEETRSAVMDLSAAQLGRRRGR